MIIAIGLVLVTRHTAVQATVIAVVIVVLFARIIVVALDAGLPVRAGGDEKVNERFDGKWRKSGG